MNAHYTFISIAYGVTVTALAVQAILCCLRLRRIRRQIRAFQSQQPQKR